MSISAYPDNWSEIATENKRLSGYCCHECHLKCLPPGQSYRHLSISLRRKLSAQTHHIDGDPSNNDSVNLICLCAACHLGQHRYRPQITPGQLSFDLKLPKQPKTRRLLQKRRIFQFTLADLIDRLPLLQQHQQLKLAIDLQPNSGF